MSEFFEYKKNAVKSDTLSDTEQDILYMYRTLSEKNKELLIAYLSGLSKK